MNQRAFSLLVVEDNQADQDKIKRLLKQQDQFTFEIETVYRLSEALALCMAKQIDIVLLDVRLPDSNGIETILTLTRKNRNLPIVVLTEYGDEKLELDVLQSGAQDYLLKEGITTAKLVATLYHALERKQAENTQFEGSQRANLSQEQNVHQIKDRLLELVHHQFRTPLTTIISSTALLELKYDEMGPENHRRHIQKIGIAANQLVDFLNNIQAVQQAENNRLGLYPRRIQLDAYVKDFIEQLKHEFNTKQDVRLIIYGLRDEVILDGSLFGEILRQLLSNAMRYSESNSGIDVHIECNAEEIVLTVIDRGVGIAEQDQPHIFESMYRADAVENVPGLGLGLTIAQAAAKVHGGKISFESELGKGSTFRVTLPYLTLKNCTDC